MIVLAGATPVFADVDKQTLMVTTESIEPRITSYNVCYTKLLRIGAEGKSNLGHFGADHYPVGLDMRKVIEKTTGHGKTFQVVHAGST